MERLLGNLKINSKICYLQYIFHRLQKKGPPKNRTASNDCLPYENLDISFS